jgi:CubicO group peptidase (beta-lactamase class C family)
VTIVVSLLLAWAAQAAAQGAYRDSPELPAGAVGERLRQLVEVASSGSQDRVRALVENDFTPEFRDAVPLEEHLGLFASLYATSRGFDIHGVRTYDPPREDGNHVLIARNRLTGGWQAFVVALEADPPNRFAGIRFAPARAPSDLPPPPARGEEQIVAELEALLDRLVAADAFSGTVLLARGGDILFLRAYGLASRRYGVPNTVDTRFNLGSMNKMFTSVVVAQLVEEGALRLDDSLARYVGADWLPREVTEPIRVEHLLTHTSGLGSYFNDAYSRSSRELFRELDDYKPLVAGERSEFPPGTGWRYSNTGMLLLGVVVEKVTGTSYFEAVRERVYRRAGMRSTDCYDMDDPVPNLAMGYTRVGTALRENTFMHVIRGGPAGGGFSTALDLYHFARALTGGRLLGPEMTEKVLSPKPDLGSPDYGYGFSVDEVAGERVVGHSGGFPGISSNLDMFLDSGYVAVVLTNLDQAAIPVQQAIREMLGSRVRTAPGAQSSTD